VLPVAAARTHALGDGPQAHVAGFELGFELAAGLAAVTAVALTVRSRKPALAR